MTTTADRAAAAPPEEFAVESAAPRWPRPALAALLAVTAALYLWKLSASGYGNAFYAAAAQAGAQSWKAWFFGSLDAGNFVTVDKPPAATWVTGLSVRLFGMNPWAVLAPQALIGVGTVAALFATVRRAVSDPRLGAAAGLLAGATLAVTPAAVLIFRYNNPDALMVLLMVLGAYCVTRATRTASWRWLALAGVALGFAFLTKMFAGVMVLPGFVLSYLLFAPTSVRKRLSHLLLAGAGLLVSAGWWVLIVELWPDDARPYISNSTDNSVLNLALGYNGVSRILGRNNTPHVTEDARNPLHYGTFSSSPGLHRLFTGEMGYEISWFLPVALFVIAFAVYLWRRAALSRDEKAAAVMWTSWIMLCGTMFTYMDGMVHPVLHRCDGAGGRRGGGTGGRVGVAVSVPPVRSGRIGGHDRARGGVVGVATASRRSRSDMATLGDRALGRGGRRHDRVALGQARPGRGPDRGHRRCHRIRYRHREHAPRRGHPQRGAHRRRMADCR